MTPDPQADLRAMMEALPADIQWEPQCGRIELRAPDGLTRVQMDDLMSWLLRAPALVRTLLEERDALQADRDRLAGELELEQVRNAVIGVAAADGPTKEIKAEHNTPSLALVFGLRDERDALKAEVERLDDVRTKQIRVLQDIIKNDQTPAGIEVKRLAERAERAEAEIERLRKPSVIRDGFPPDSLLEEAARLGRELANNLDDLWREGRRRMWSD